MWVVVVCFWARGVKSKKVFNVRDGRKYFHSFTGLVWISVTEKGMCGCKKLLHQKTLGLSITRSTSFQVQTEGVKPHISLQLRTRSRWSRQQDDTSGCLSGTDWTSSSFRLKMPHSFCNLRPFQPWRCSLLLLRWCSGERTIVHQINFSSCMQRWKDSHFCWQEKGIKATKSANRFQIERLTFLLLANVSCKF